MAGKILHLARKIPAGRDFTVSGRRGQFVESGLLGVVDKCPAQRPMSDVPRIVLLIPLAFLKTPGNGTRQKMQETNLLYESQCAGVRSVNSR